MGNEMNVTTPIASSRAKRAEELEKNRKKQVENKKEKVEDKKPSEKEVKKAADQARAMEIFGKATADIKAESFTNYNDYKAACEDAFQKEVDARKATADTTDDLTPEQIKIAQNYMKSKDFKAAKKDIEFNNQNYIRSLQADVDGVNKGDRKKQTDAILKQQYEAREAELKAQYEKGEIDEKEYKELRNANKDQYKAYKKANGTTTGFQRFFGRKEKVGDRIHNVGAKQENLAVTREFMTSGKEGAIESRIKPELMAKLKAAGYDATPESMQKLYEIYDANSGTDATVNYSYKPKQEGERDQLIARLNENLPEGAQEFSMNDVKDIGRALGYKVEKAVDFGTTMRDAGRGLLIGAPGVLAKSEATAVAVTADAIAKTSSTVPFGLAIPGVTAAVGAGVSAYQQYHRVEDRAIPTTVPETVTTIDEYNAYLDKQATPEGARLGKGIAKHFINPYTNEFDINQMNTALAQASGTVDTKGTPCNYEEAEALLTGLESGKIKPVFVEPKKEPEITKEVVVNTQTDPVIEKRKVTTYTIKNGDNPWAIAQGIYGDGNKYVRQVQAMVPDGAAFWGVGTKVDFGPITLADGTVVEPKENPNVIAGTVSRSYKGKSTRNVNHVERERVIKGATYGADAYNVDGQGNRTYKQNVTSGHTNVIDRNNEVNNYKKKNESETHTITVEG